MDFEDRQYSKEEVLNIALIAHAAGYFDGEGCVTSWLSPNGGLTIATSITNTYYRGLEHFKEIFGGQITDGGLPEGSKNKPCWKWRIQNIDDNLVFLEKITPYLQDKQSQAEYAISILKHLQQRRRKRITEEDKKTFLRYYHELRAMKQDTDRLARSSILHGFDQPEHTVGTTGNEFSRALSDKNSPLMFAWNASL